MMHSLLKAPVAQPEPGTAGGGHLVLPTLAVGLVVLLALLVAMRRSEPAPGWGRFVAAGVSVAVVGWMAVAPLVLEGPGAAGYLEVMLLRFGASALLLLAFWWRRTRQALMVALVVTLLMALPELSWLAAAVRG
ncbi:hypothetical protein [Kytococcus sp. Marseille-QA3725]